MFEAVKSIGVYALPPAFVNLRSVENLFRFSAPTFHSLPANKLKTYLPLNAVFLSVPSLPIYFELYNDDVNNP